VRVIELRKVKKYARILTAIGLGTACALFPAYRYYIVGGLIAQRILARKRESRIIVVKRPLLQKG
jgi:hypothetical protein